jgi:hypothetical protein
VTVISAPSDIILQSKTLLESGDLDTAETGISNNLKLYPNDPTLNFFYSITVFTSILGDNNLKTFLTNLGITGVPNSFASLTNAIYGTGFNILLDNSPLTGFPNTLKLRLYAQNISGLQKLVNDVLLSRINLALNSLQYPLAVYDFSVSINVANIANDFGGNLSPTTYRFDRDEICLYSAYLSMIAAYINVILAQNVDFDFAKMETFITNQGNTNSYYNPFNDPNYPNFGYLTSDGTTRYHNAKTELINAVDTLSYGVYFLWNKTNANSQDILLPSMISTNEFNVITNLYVLAKTTLNDGYIAYTNVETDTYWNGEEYESDIYTNTIGGTGISIGKFLDSAPSLRSLIFKLDASGEPLLYDSNNTIVTSPTSGNVYFLQFNDPSFGGLLKSPITNSLPIQYMGGLPTWYSVIGTAMEVVDN